MQIRYKKLSPNAKAPKQNKTSDAGYDLFALETVIINPFERKIIPTGIAVEIPRGYYGRIAPRSGLAVKHGIDILAGVVDSGYRDALGVVAINFEVSGFLAEMFRPAALSALLGSPGRYTVNAGDRIAQLIIEKCDDEVEWVESVELDSSDRGTTGFGNSGK